MATTWITRALNALPLTLAVHDGKPVAVDYTKPLSWQLAHLREARPGLDRYGLVHSVNGTSLFYAYSHGDLIPGQAKTAQLCRNPIMLAESMAAVTQRDWMTAPKFRSWAQVMRASILKGRLNGVELNWPASVKELIAANDERAISRLLGIWNRTLLEATDLFFCNAIHQLLAKRGNKPGEAHPIFRFEDYTANRVVFSRLCDHIAGVNLDAAAVDRAFAVPALNPHRASAVNDPAEVYRAWTSAERDMFDTIVAVTGLAAFLENSGLYRLSDDGAAASLNRSSEFNLRAVLAT